MSNQLVELMVITSLQVSRVLPVFGGEHDSDVPGRAAARPLTVGQGWLSKVNAPPPAPIVQTSEGANSISEYAYSFS